MLDAIKKSMLYNQVLDMIYMGNDRRITKRRIKPFKISGNTFVAYCYFRGSRRTFKFDGVLALVPVVRKESLVI